MIHIVENEPAEPTRLSDYLKGLFPVLTTNSGIKKAIKRGLIKVNDIASATGQYVKQGDVISYEQEPAPLLDLPMRKIPVIYEDDDIAIVCKPPGLTSSGNMKTTLANYLPHILRSSTKNDRLLVPKLAHRLDKATSGLIVAGKTNEALIKLGQLHTNQKIIKKYAAIVEGHVPKNLVEFTNAIDGQSAHTVVDAVNWLGTRDKTSLLYISLQTGRTHQIRIHLSEAGYPIVGDPIYNADGLSFRKGLFLCAQQISLPHPITDEQISLSIELPAKFQKYTHLRQS